MIFLEDNESIIHPYNLQCSWDCAQYRRVSCAQMTVGGVKSAEEDRLKLFMTKIRPTHPYLSKTNTVLYCRPYQFYIHSWFSYNLRCTGAKPNGTQGCDGGRFSLWRKIHHGFVPTQDCDCELSIFYILLYWLAQVWPFTRTALCTNPRLPGAASAKSERQVF